MDSFFGKPDQFETTVPTALIVLAIVLATEDKKAVAPRN